MHKVYFDGSETSCDVGKILCIGRNYAKHVAEMGGSAPSEPWVFLKPSSALIATGECILLPYQSSDVHHEVELVVLIADSARHITSGEALDLVRGYAVGLDMTARDLQQAAKASGRPWSISKGFDTFAPVGSFVPASQIPDPQQLEIVLSVGSEVRQQGHTRDMIFSVAELLAFCSSIFTLEKGDLLFTGTPDGVGPVLEGDVLEARISGLPVLKVDVRR